MIQASIESGCAQTFKSKSKPYWCPDLNKISKQKQFWWKLWCSNNRPRSGVVYDCYKGVKKLFRKTQRHFAQNLVNARLCKINVAFQQQNMKKFWNEIKRFSKKPVNSRLTASEFPNTLKRVMQDSSPFTSEQCAITNQVKTYYNNFKDHVGSSCITPNDILHYIKQLKNNSAPGCDGLTAEHLIHGSCPSLLNHLCTLFNIILSHSIVPYSFCIGIIIPILKKPNANPNIAENFRPLTLGTTYSKLLEKLIMSELNIEINKSQFGFRKNRGCDQASALLNDTISYCLHNNSSVFLCSLDAQKCFDKIWHDGLFYKLIDVLPVHIWMFIYNWYSKLYSVVRFNDQYSQPF
jgi:hypothetical protein